MGSLRVTYKVTGKQVGIDGLYMTPAGPADHLVHIVNFGFPDMADSERVYKFMEIGKNYFADFTPTEEAGMNTFLDDARLRSKMASLAESWLKGQVKDGAQCARELLTILEEAEVK